MKRITLAVGLSCMGAATAAGCATATDLDAEADASSITAALELGALAHDVTGVRFDVVAADATCDGEALATETRQLESEPLPASLAGQAGAFRPFADALFVLDPGSYRVCATPLAGDAPSTRCAPAEMEVEVASGQTNEVVLISQCSAPGSGGLDVVVALNDPPRITAVTLDPSKFVSVCESLAISAQAEDPNGDAISYAWTLTSGPEGGVLVADGASAVFSGPAGDYAISVSASDVHGNTSSLAFPVHVSDATCAAPQAVQDIFAATCAPCHTTGGSGGLRLPSAEATHENLVWQNARAGACADRLLVVPGDPAGSYLIAKLRGAPEICGTQMPRNRPALSEEQIQVVEAWIAALPQ
jgi:mono/diheme cytochrome c family protein